jgi:hypothetical protein
MKAIKIDTIAKDVYLVDIDNTLESIYSNVDCEVFTCPVILKNNDALYVDDEGLFNNDGSSYKGCFVFNNGYQPYYGHGLIVGNTEDGESAEVLSFVKDIKEKVTFLDYAEGKHILEQLKNVKPYVIGF